MPSLLRPEEQFLQLTKPGRLYAKIDLDGDPASATPYGFTKRGNEGLKKGTIRGIVAVYVLLFLLCTTWPGAMLFNSIEPLILGLPFNLFVLAILISVALVVLWALYISETRPED